MAWLHVCKAILLVQTFAGFCSNLGRSRAFPLSLMFPLFPFGRLLIGWLQAAWWGWGILPFQGKPKLRSGPPVSPGSLTEWIIHLCVCFLGQLLGYSDSWAHDQSVQFSCSVLYDSLQPHESQYARPPCPSPTPGVYSNSCPSSWWCHPAISSSVFPFSSCPQSLWASESFPMSQFFAWGGQSIGVSASASVLPMNTQDSW